MERPGAAQLTARAGVPVPPTVTARQRYPSTEQAAREPPSGGVHGSDGFQASITRFAAPQETPVACRALNPARSTSQERTWPLIGPLEVVPPCWPVGAG